jgi:DNA-binding winged helix-turn-helix (wHTH) protein
MNDLADAGRLSPGRPAVSVKIGLWVFDPRSGELSGGGETRRMEYRAAQALALLCERRGEIVTRQEIVERLWGERAVSPNSLAVVIRDIRRALGDDARNPQHLETVSKRGYRLASRPDGPAGGSDDARGTGGPLAARRLALPVAAFGLVAALSAAALLPGSARHDGPAIVVEPVHNESGSAAWDPSARALTELAVERLSRSRGVDVYGNAPGGGGHGARFILRSKLILWDGQPTLSLRAVDAASGRIRWSGMAEGPPFYPGAVRQFDRLAAFLRAPS